jgi:hypothetical protein
MIKTGVAWLVDKITAFATGALQLAGAITGIPLLDMAHGFVQTIVDGVKGVQQWATGAFTSAAAWLEDLVHRVVDFIKPYAEVLCSIGTALINPVGIPGIIAGWAWRWLPDCIKPPLIDLLLDAVIGFLRGMPSLPMLGPLWPLLKSGVLGFLEALRAKDDKTKLAVSNKLAKIISGASPMFLLGFVKGLLKGIWDGIKMPFEAIWMILKGIEKAGDFFRALGDEAQTRSRPKPAQPAAAKPGAPTPTHQPLPSIPSVITPDQASSVVGGVASQLNAQKPPRPPVPPGGTRPATPASGNEYQQLAHQAKRMGGELAGPSKTVATQFMPAVKELFSGGKGMSLDDLIAKLSKVWEAAKAAVAKLGGQIANMIVDFLMKDSAEEEIGDAIGYLVGMIAFQALLDAFTVGAWSEVSVVLTAIAKFLNWPMKFLGEAMGLMKKLGGFILDGLKSLGKMVAEAGAGALREVTGALRQIAGKLGEFADELLAKFGGKGAEAADGAAAHALEGDAAKTVEKDAADAATSAEKTELSAGEREAQKAEELLEAQAVIQGIKQAAQRGHVPGPALVAALDGLKGRYRWIKGFGPVGRPAPFDLMLYASEYNEGPYNPGPLSPEGEPVKTPTPEELLERARALPEKLQELTRRIEQLPEDFPIRQQLLEGVRSLSGDASAVSNLATRHPGEIAQLQRDIENIESKLGDYERQLNDAAHAAEHGVAPRITRSGDMWTAVDPSTGETIGVLTMDAEGYMNLGVYTKEAQSELRGNQVLSALRQAAERDGASIRGMRGLWYKGDNLASFNEAILAGKTPEAAAWDTFTGTMADRYGYRNARIDYARSVRNPDGTFQKAELWFD